LILPGTFLGERIVSGDHTIHFITALQLKDRLFTEGHLWGWSHTWFAGYPTGYFYPFGGDLLVIILYALFFGLVSFKTAYALAVWLVFFGHGFALFVLGKKYFNRWVGLLAALLFTLDFGGDNFGGWIWLVYFGVWGINLSFVFTLLAFSWWEEVCFGERYRHIGIFGLLMGLAIISHPLQLVHITLFSVLGLILAMIFAQPLNIFRVIGRVLSANVIGILVGGLYLLPFIYFRDYAFSAGLRWLSLQEMGEKIANASLFESMWAYTAVAGVGGLLLLLRSQRYISYLIATSIFFFLWLGSTTLFDFLKLGELSASLKAIEYKRFAMIVKNFWFLSAGFFMVWLFQRLFYESNNDLVPIEKGKMAFAKHSMIGKKFSKYFLIGVLTLPVLLPGMHNMFLKTTFRNVQYLSEAGDWQTKKEIAQWINNVKTKDARFFRVALSRSLSSSHYYLDLTKLLDVPLYKTDYTAALFYKHKVSSAHPRILKTLSVRYIISDKKISSPYINLINRFDYIYLYEYKGWNPNIFSVIDGDASIEVRKFSDEEILMKVSPGASGRLMLHVSYFPQWQATLNNKEIAISTISLDEDDNSAFMAVKLYSKGGEYRFIYKRGLVEAGAVYFFLFGLVLVGSCFYLDKLRQIKSKRRTHTET